MGKIFGFPSEFFWTFLFLLKYFIYSKFKGIMPAYIAFKSFVKTQKETEYFLAKRETNSPFIEKKLKFDV